jgi:glycosyltransferase involved in cell wall biosynthesis
VRRTLLRYGIRQPYVLMLGRVSADKGAMRAIRAVTALRSSRLQIGLVLAGEVSPEMRRTLARASHRLGDSVTVLGRVSEEHKWGLLKGAVALLLPSEVESFGLVILEAWACGKPVIGCRAGGLPDLIRHGETGLLVDIDDAPGLAAAIRGLVESPATAAVLGEAGEKQVCEYTWTAVAARIRAVYDQVLQEAPR